MSKIKVDEIESIDGTKLLITKDMFMALPTAWVNFDATATSPMTIANGGIRDAFNVSSVVRTATGYFEIYFETPMDNNGYSTVATIGYGGVNYVGIDAFTTQAQYDDAVTINYTRIATRHGSTNTNYIVNNLVMFGGKA